MGSYLSPYGEDVIALTRRDAPDVRSSSSDIPVGGGFRPEVPGDLSGAARLTIRERQVLVLLGTAAGNREIARKLDISERTAKAHLTHIMNKIGVESRLQAALFAFAHHELICPPRQCPKVQ